MSSAQKSYASWTRSTLAGDSAVAAIVGTRITPYLRNRDDSFPSIVYSVPREEFETESTGEIVARTAEVSVVCMARTYLDADELAAAVIDAIEPGTQGACTVSAARVTGLEREFQDAYDGSADLVYFTTVSAILIGTN